MYEVALGTSDYVLSSPLFPYVSIADDNVCISQDLKNGFPSILSSSCRNKGDEYSSSKNNNTLKPYRPKLDIVAIGTGPKNILVDSISFNNEKILGPSISHELLQQGGILQYVMQVSVKNDKNNMKNPVENTENNKQISVFLEESRLSIHEMKKILREKNDIIVKLQRELNREQKSKS